MELVSTSRADLIGYIEQQLFSFFPKRKKGYYNVILGGNIDEALSRVEVCINAVKAWPVGKFDYSHSSQYCQFLYYLANTIWKNSESVELCVELFSLNKALNGIDLFYEIKMPEVFFIGHSVGIVLAKATYGNYLVLYQNSTVGKNHGTAPVLEDGVILYPNAAVIGGSVVREKSIVSQGVSVINAETEKGKIAFQGSGGDLVFKSAKHDILNDFFRMT